MNPDDKVQGAVPAEALQKIREHFQGIRALLPFLESYDSDEKASFIKPGPALLQVARQVPDAVAQHASVLPTDLVEDARELDRDIALADSLEIVSNELDSLARDVRDTQLAAQHDVMRTTLEVRRVYNALGSRADGLRQLLAALDEQLKKRSRRGRRKPDAASPAAPRTPQPPAAPSPPA